MKTLAMYSVCRNYSHLFVKSDLFERPQMVTV